MPSIITNRRVTITSVTTGAAYDSDAQALFDRMTVDPGTDRKNIINNFFVGIKEDLSIANIIDIFDCIWFTAAHDQQASRLNWVQNAFNLTEVNVPVWELDRGYTNVSTISYLDTNYNPATQGVNYTLNNCSFGTYLRHEVGGNISMGIGNTVDWRGSQIFQRYADVFYSRANSFDLSSAVSMSAAGLFSVGRVNATQHTEYKNGILQNTAASNSLEVLSMNFYLLCSNTQTGPSNFNVDNQTAFAYIANGSSINHLNLYDRVQTYLTALGAQV